MLCWTFDRSLTQMPEVHKVHQINSDCIVSGTIAEYFKETVTEIRFIEPLHC